MHQREGGLEMIAHHNEGGRVQFLLRFLWLKALGEEYAAEKHNIITPCLGWW